MTDLTDQEVFYNTVNKYDPAFDSATYNYKLEHKKVFSGEADQILVRELYLLQKRCQAAIRNSPYARNALNKHVEMLGDLTVTWINSDKEVVPEMQAIWEEFESSCALDGYGNFKTLIKTAQKDEFINGASFLRFQYRNTGTAIPLKLEGISSNLHAYNYKEATTPPNSTLSIRNGIRFADTKPVSYFFWSNYWELDDLLSPTPTEIPAEELLHCFDRVYPNQWLGIPVLSSILIAIYTVEDLLDATAARQTAAQAVTWVVKNTNPLAPTATGSPVQVQANRDNLSKKEVIFRSQGGGTQYLNRGEELNLIQSADIGNNLNDFIKHLNYLLSATLGIPYYLYTGDTSGLNFSSIRAIMVEVRKKIEYIHYHQTIPLLYEPITAKVLELTRLYKPRTPKATPKFHLPRWRGVDDLKDAQADILEVVSGINTIDNVLEERNVTFEEIIQSLNKIMDSPLKFLLEQKNSSMGQTNNTQANSNSSSN